MNRFLFRIAAVLAVSWVGLATLHGQESGKRHLTQDDYRLWSDMEMGKLSPDGSSTSYSLHYATGEDTLFVSRSDKQAAIPQGRNGLFTRDGHFVCLSDGKLVVTDTKTAQQRTLAEVKTYGLALGRMAWLCKNGTLAVGDFDGNVRYSLDSVDLFSISPDKKLLAYVQQNKGTVSVGLLTIATGKKWTAATESGPVLKLGWADDSKQLAFLSSHSPVVVVHRYDVVKRIGEPLRLEDHPATSGRFRVPETCKPIFTGDGHLIVETSEQYEAAAEGGPEVWNAADRWLYPFDVLFDGFRKFPKLFLWKRDGTLVQVTDNALPEARLLPGGRHALLFNPKCYAPHFRWKDPRDLYLLDLSTGKRTLFLSRQDDETSPVDVAPDGKHIAYFDGRQWMVYAMASRKRTPLKCPDEVGRPSNRSYAFVPYDVGGWSQDGKVVFLYDRFDVWAATLDGKSLRRLTRGREQDVVFRLSKASAIERTRNLYDGFMGTSFDTARELLVQAESTDCQFSGLYALDMKTGVRRLVWNHAMMKFALANGCGSYSWIEQSYETPPKVMLLTDAGTPMCVGQSNKQHDTFLWGSVRQIQYKGENGETLFGSLYLPPLYDPGKRYPMIVSVYERQSYAFHEYILPRHQNTDGFNVTNLLAKGYVILLPDIAYTIGDPGPSAVFCLLAALDAALEEANIDPKRIGLNGHSFGGFETNFAVTQTDRFAAVVSGNGYADLVSGYLSMNENYRVPEIFRYEHFQMRMGKSLYDDREGYLRNSAVLQAEKVTTPLLTWVGAKDRQVPPHHTYEFYHALRRLGKKHIMLVYPDEGHVVDSPENNIDLNRRIEQWFGHYLKGEPEQPWMLAR